MYKLSNQAVGSIMMCLQKGILEGIDITDLMKGFQIEANEENELVVKNPPTFKLDKEQKEDNQLA
jgi:hypothetical protein